MLPKTKPIHKPTVPPMAAPIFILSKVEGSILVISKKKKKCAGQGHEQICAGKEKRHSKA